MAERGKDDEHWREVDRLWRAFRRDFSASVLGFAGFAAKDEGEKAFQRLMRNWEQLCKHDLDVAGRIYHGMDQMQMAMALHDEPHSPSAHQLRQMQEVVGMATIAREKNPGAEVKTVGELLRLGDESIRKEIDDETGDAK